jgi:hypothetical protein
MSVGRAGVVGAAQHGVQTPTAVAIAAANNSDVRNIADLNVGYCAIPFIGFSPFANRE